LDLGVRQGVKLGGDKAEGNQKRDLNKYFHRTNPLVIVGISYNYRPRLPPDSHQRNERVIQ
jgi:hypothetical protein